MTETKRKGLSYGPLPTERSHPFCSGRQLMRRRDVLTGAVALAVCAKSPKEAEAVVARAISAVEKVQPLAASDVLTDQDGNQITDDALMTIVVDEFQ